MDIISYILSKKYTNDTVIGLGAIKGSPAMISSIVDNSDGTHDITFSWKDTSDVTHTSVLTVSDGETPTFSSTVITGGHRITFTTEDKTVSFDVMDGSKGDSGISVVSSNVDDNNNLTFTLSNGNVISAGKINAVTIVDTALSTSSSNPVENKVITNALNNKVDKESGKGLSTEDFTTAEKDKLANIEDNAQVNVIEKLIINGTEATVTDKAVALTLITSAVSNLQNYYLKSETYTKTEIEDLIGSTVGVTIEIVEELPTEGQSNVIYFLPTETTDVYSQYIYTSDGWILIGSTTVDLSKYYTKTQVDTLLTAKQDKLTIDSFPTSLSNNPVASGGVYTAIAQMQSQFQYSNMPTASADNLGYVYQYIGATGTYTQNMFYRCIYDDTLGEYQWKEVIFNATVTVDSAISSTSENPVQNKVIKAALDEKQDVIQYSTMPSAQDNLGKIVQYNGTTTSTYTNGYFYKATYDSENDLYYWKQIEFSEGTTVDSALSNTSENPVQNKVITNAVTEITDVIPSEASSSNQLVDRNSLGTASQKNFTPYVSPDNADVPLSSSVYSAITSAVYGAYHPSGSKTIAELTSDLLVFANIGNVYKITEDGVTTNLFIGGAGQTIHTGDNAVVVYGGQPNTFLFDLQSGSIDLTPYQTKALESAVESQTTVEGALGALSTNKATQAEVNDIVNVLGAKNLIPYPYHRQNGYTTNGATFTYDDEGVITVNKVVGNSTAYFALFSNVLYPDAEKFLEPNTSYILSMELENATDTSCFVQTQNGIDLAAIRNKATGKYEISFTTPETMDFLAVALYYAAEKTENNAKVKLMIRLASITDDTYAPYCMTNKELTNRHFSNPNLLDNPWFTINQRGLSTYSNVNFSYTVDRWLGSSGFDLYVDSDGVSVSLGNSSIFQRFEDSLYNFLVGKTVTLSALKSNGSIVSISGVVKNSGNSFRYESDSDVSIYLTKDQYANFVQVVFKNTTVKLRAVKLELGSVSTLAMDTVPNYATELLKCQRYYQKIFFFEHNILSTSAVYDHDYYVTPKRTNGSLTAYSANGTANKVSFYTNSQWEDNNYDQLEWNAGSLNTNIRLRVTIPANSYVKGSIEVSADL